MKKLNSERFYLNRVGEDAPQTVRLTLRMTDAVDGRMLRVAAVSGKFCLTFMQQFSTDAYLDAFLGELREQGITWEITGRHPMEIASIADL